MTPAAISIHGLSVAYGKYRALQNVNGAFPAGSLTAVTGPNGAGKSTLLNAIIGEVPIVSGRITFQEGHSIRQIAYLPQISEIDRKFPLSVEDVVLLGAWKVTGAFAAATDATVSAVKKALATVGLEGREARQIDQLSTGQFQRVLFARLLLQDAPVILLDEPFSAIDQNTTRDLIAIVRAWHREGRTVIAALHDFDQIRDAFPECVVLAREVVGWGATETAMSAANLLRARQLIDHADCRGRGRPARGAER